MQNPFEDLIPPAQNVSVQQQQQMDNPFADLIPPQNANVPQGTSQQTQTDPSVYERAIVSLMHQQSPLGPTQDYDPEAENASPLERVGKFGVDVAAGMLPFQMGAAGLLKYGGGLAPKFAKFLINNPFKASAIENALAGAAYSGVNNGPTGAAIGGTLGAVSPVAGYVGSKVAPYIYEKIAQSAIPGLTEKATDYMQKLLSPSDYAESLKNKFNTAFDQNTANWTKVDQAAADLDNSLAQSSGGPPGSLVTAGQKQTQTFDNTPYVNYIDNFINKIQKLEPARQQEYSQALAFANEAKEAAPQSVQGAVATHKNLNQALSEFMSARGIPAANRQAKIFVNGLKDNLKNNMSNDIIDSRMKDLGYDQTFSDIWNQANKSHQDLQSFYKAPDKLGNIVKSNTLQKALQGNTPEGNIIGQYAPRPSQTGTAGMEQLATILGSKPEAQDAVRAYLSRRPLTSGVSTLDVANKYAELSPQQRDFLYGNTPEGNLLKTVNDVRQKFGKEPARSLLRSGAHHLFSVSAPAAIGYFGSELMGGDRRENIASAIAGLGLSGYGKYLARGLSPESVQGLIRRASTAPTNYGRYFNMPLQVVTNPGGNQQ